FGGSGEQAATQRQYRGGAGAEKSPVRPVFHCVIAPRPEESRPMCLQPPSTRPAGILLGWGSPRRGRFGFAPGGPTAQPADEPLWYHGDNHLMTVAPTGAGKGRGVIIPNLLSYPGPAVVIDPKGEAYQTTARRRRQLGQRVVVLDPFRVASPHS